MNFSKEELSDLWNGVYHLGSSCIIQNEEYTSVQINNTSDQSDGDSWDYIVKRTSDGKFFCFNVWDAGRNGYLFEDGIYEVEPFLLQQTQFVKIDTSKYEGADPDMQED